jgi:hypothetical protein
MTKRTVIVPITDNDGRSLAPEIANIEIELLRLVGGFSVNASAGVWSSPDGTTYRDQNLTYVVVGDEVTDARLTDRLHEWAIWLRQEVLYTDSSVVEVAQTVVGDEHSAPQLPEA